MPKSQLRQQSSSTLCLLILAGTTEEATTIVNTLKTAQINCSYEVATTEGAYLSLLQENAYDAVLFSYPLTQTSDRNDASEVATAPSNNSDSPLKALGLLRYSGQDIPLILITEALGEEWAVRCIKAGITDYVLKQRLFRLPSALQQAIAKPTSESHQRLEQLEEENQRLSAANHAKSELIATMSHELRTPLASILGFSRVLRQQIYGSLNEKQMEYLSALSHSGEHLLALMDDLLDISKIEAGKEELSWETVPVQEVCMESLSLVRERAREKGLELLLKIDRSVTVCTADQRRLKQILVNFLSNAVKFTEAGSVTLKVEDRQQTIAFSAIDTGIGISEADKQTLFQPFEQVKSYSRRQHQGSGLGLALSLKLARLHGGDIAVSSSVGHGSRFTLHLPARSKRNAGTKGQGDKGNGDAEGQ